MEDSLGLIDPRKGDNVVENAAKHADEGIGAEADVPLTILGIDHDPAGGYVFEDRCGVGGLGDGGDGGGDLFADFQGVVAAAQLQNHLGTLGSGAGAGIKVIEMNFLPSVNVVCSECRGRRYKNDTLAVRYKGKNINDVLEMPISEAYEFFSNIPSIAQKLKAMVDVGLGYVRLGQSAVTLSGGESQRMKLAAELARKGTGNTLYILDEPTTGLHFDDIKVLLDVLQQLVEQGNTVVVIEHNLDILKSVD